jgi:hypothetical protein
MDISQVTSRGQPALVICSSVRLLRYCWRKWPHLRSLLGILDLVVAVGMGALGSLLLGRDAVFPTTIMSQMPLVLVPTFFVPLFVILHVIALLQVRE